MTHTNTCMHMHTHTGNSMVGVMSFLACKCLLSADASELIYHICPGISFTILQLHIAPASTIMHSPLCLHRVWAMLSLTTSHLNLLIWSDAIGFTIFAIAYCTCVRAILNFTTLPLNLFVWSDVACLCVILFVIRYTESCIFLLVGCLWTSSFFILGWNLLSSI